MNKWYFTADMHLGHENIMRHCQRPFATIAEHDDVLIKNFNAVASGNTIVAVGDLTLAHKYDDVRYYYLRRLKGNIIWVKGNHDYWMNNRKEIEYRHIYHKRIKLDANASSLIDISCCHYPLRSWQNSRYGSLQLHGHCHGTILPYCNQLDVGVDSAFKWLGAYRPFSLQEVLEIIAETNKTAPHHDYYYEQE